MSISALGNPSPAQYSFPRPFYDTGRIFFYDGFEDWVIRGGRADNNPSLGGATLITAEVARTGQNSLQLRVPSPATGNYQDYNQVWDIGGLAGPLIVGMEAHVMLRAKGSVLGFSIERTGGPSGSSSVKREWRAEYDSTTDNHNEVSGASGVTKTPLFTSHLQRTDEGSLQAVPERAYWHPLKLAANLDQIGPGCGRWRAAGQSVLFGQSDRSTDASASMGDNLVRFEFHVTGNNPPNPNPSVYIDDVFLTFEPGV